MRSLSITPILAGSAVIIALLGCTDQNNQNGTISRPVAFVTDHAPIEFTFPAGWREDAKQHPYDLQCIAPSQRLNTGIFAYTRDEFPSGKTPTEVFHEQIEDIGSRREDFVELEPTKTSKRAGKTITSIAYSGKRDSSQNHYRFSLIEFDADENTFAVVLQVSVPREWEQAKPILQKIAQSARLVPTESNPNEFQDATPTPTP